MKNWKKLLAIGTSITMAISMAACGGSSKDSTKKNEKRFPFGTVLQVRMGICLLN